MRPAAWLLLLLKSLRLRRRRYLAAAAGLAVGMLALGLTVGGAAGIGRSLGTHLEGMLPESRVTLRPKVLNVIWLQVETALITRQTLGKVEALPGVRRVSPEASIRFPISAEATLVGNTLATDVTVVGVRPWVLGEELPAGFIYEAGRPLPGVVSRYFLDLYNSTYAEGNGMPRLSPSAVVGRNFTLLLGVSTMLRNSTPPDEYRTLPCRLAGLSTNPGLLGLVVPLEAVEALNEEFGYAPGQYRALHVDLVSPDAIEPLRERLDALGLRIEDRIAPLRRMMAILRVLGALFAGFGALVFALSLAYLLASIQSMLEARRHELALWHALGASRRRLAGLLGVEIVLVSGLGLALGLAAAQGLIHYVNATYIQWRGDKSYLPEQLFALRAGWMLALGLLCWVAALALGLRRLAQATRGNLAQALHRAEL